MAILGMVNWIYKWYKKSGENTIEEISDVFTDLILHAVLTPEKTNNKHDNNLKDKSSYLIDLFDD